MSDLAFPDADYGSRMRRVRQAMTDANVDVLALSVGSDLPYLTGYEAMPLERLTLLVVTEVDASLLVPALEAPRVVERPGVFEIVPWAETDDPIAAATSLIGLGASVGVGAQTWAVFLLQLKQALPEKAFVDATSVMRTLRIVKDETEIAMLRGAAQAVDRVAVALADAQFSGRTERDLAREVSDRTVAEGHQVATFHIVASGPNAASPHHEPGERVIEPGDSVIVDFGGRFHGYCSDTTRTFSVGEPSAELVEVHQVVAEANRVGAEAVRPGAVPADVDRAARDVIDDAGYGEYFIHRLGHGIGLDGHEDPYLVAGNAEPLAPGMAFSIEPGIYLRDRLGVRIEDIAVCTNDGIEVLNGSPHDLLVVG